MCQNIALTTHHSTQLVHKRSRPRCYAILLKKKRTCFRSDQTSSYDGTESGQSRGSISLAYYYIKHFQKQVDIKLDN